jgi:hypothetical protein
VKRRKKFTEILTVMPSNWGFIPSSKEVKKDRRDDKREVIQFMIKKLLSK